MAFALRVRHDNGALSLSLPAGAMWRELTAALARELHCAVRRLDVRAGFPPRSVTPARPTQPLAELGIAPVRCDEIDCRVCCRAV